MSSDKNFLNSHDSSLFRNLEQALLIADSAGAIVNVNPAFETLFRYTESEVLNRPVEMLIDKDLAEKHRKHREDYIENDRRERVIKKDAGLEGIDREGRRIPLQIGLKILEDYSHFSTEKHVLCSITDLTEQLKINREKGAVSAIIENSPDAIASFNLKGEAIYFNSAFKELFETEKNKVTTAQILPQTLLISDSGVSENFTAGNGKWQGENLIRIDETQNLLTVTQIVFTHYDEKNRPYMITTIIRDLSELVRLRKRHRAYLQTLEDLYIEKENMVSEISDKLNGPLKRMKQILFDSEQSADYSTAEIKKLFNVFEDELSQLSSFSRGKVYYKPRLSVNNFNGTVHNAYLKFTKHTGSDNASISFEKDPRLDRSYYFDPDRLAAIIRALLKAALRLSLEKDIQLKTRLISENETGAVIETAISERSAVTGEYSIQAAAESYESEEYRKISDRTLSELVSLVEAIDGRVSFQSDNRNGFHLKLQFTLADKNENRESRLPGSAEVTHTPFSKLREINPSILVVDDEELVRMLFSEKFKSFTEIHTASNGIKAIEKYSEHTYDVIIVDLRLPGMSGWQIIETVRKIEKQQNLKQSVIVPVSADPEAVNDGLSEVFNCIPVLIKPIDFNRMYTLINESLLNK